MTDETSYPLPPEASIPHVVTYDDSDYCTTCHVHIRNPIHIRPGFSLNAKHLARQRAWSEKTFGPGSRVEGVCDHISKELEEIKDAYYKGESTLPEWVDVIILALDGAWRDGHESQAILNAIAAKQYINEQREWPDWRDAEEGKAIEHVRELPAEELSHPHVEKRRVRVTDDPLDPALRRGIDDEPVEQRPVYLVLSEAERVAGFVEPVRRTYEHSRDLGGCGAHTTMGVAIAETYARSPSFYGGTYCVGCRMHRPVGMNGEFRWVEDGKVIPQKVGTHNE